MALSFINTSGNIISEDFCSQLLIETKADYVKSKSFGKDVKKIDEDIATSFELLRERWEEIRTKVLEDQYDTTQLRDRWIKPFLGMLGFEPVYISHNLKNDAGIEYHIPYRGWDAEDAPLIHMVHSSADFDSRDKNNRTHPNKSPHDLLQQYLNNSAHSWAILINGRKVRILRDFFHSITKGFIEFDIEGIFETANTEQFRILFRMMHSSRFIGQFEKQKDEEKQQPCLLEKFHTLSRETGVRVGNNLRKQVRLAIETLGNGFAENLNPDEFDDAKVKKFYSETLNIIYRLLFLLFAEQKGWLPVKNEVYARTYSINALRERAERADYSHDNNEDLWEGLKVTFRLVTQGYTFPNGDSINAFGGQLFSDERIFHIKSPLKNRHLLKAVDALCFFTEKNLKNKINYATLAIDELGSVYESLLDYEPRLLKENTEINGRNYKRGEFVLDDRSTERKTTGSYYTDSRLVAQLIDSALVPVIENALKDKTTNEEKRKALLDLKVADIACGSGAFLIAALEKMGEYLSLIGKEEGEKPTEQELRHAKREVLQNCIYGVDLNPMALELAKFSLWITASMPNFPLSFLDHKLKCGNSLVGATPELIEKGIPVEAFSPVTLDDKTVCADLKKRVKKELEGLSRRDKGIQTGFDFKVTAVIDSEEEAEQYLHILRSEQENADEVENLAHEYEEVYKALRENTDWKLADTWTAAFFIQKDDLNKIYPTNITLQNIKQGNAIDEDLETEILRLARKYRFFHWHLEFPEVFEKASTEHGRSGGFDCILGNPPWERVKLQEKEFFSIRDETIANASSKVQRQKLISKLKKKNPDLNIIFLNSKANSEKIALFLLKSDRFPLCGKGDVNTYQVFTENCRNNITEKGSMGIIVPTGIATDDTTKDFFQDIVNKENLVSLYDFENKERLFDIHRSFKFSLLTIKGEKNKLPFDFLFFATNPKDLNEEKRHFSLSSKELFSINPNTGNCPTFRSKIDADLTKSIYNNFPVLINKNLKGKGKSLFVKYFSMFHMTNDSKLFLLKENAKNSNLHKDGFKYYYENTIYEPLYEAKMIWHFNHRFGTYAGFDFSSNSTHLTKASSEQLSDSNFEITPRYWVNKAEIPILSNVPEIIILEYRKFLTGKESDLNFVLQTWLNSFYKINDNVEIGNAIQSDEINLEIGYQFPLSEQEIDLIQNEDNVIAIKKIIESRCFKYYLSFRDITNATNERTMVNTITPNVAYGNNLPQLLVYGDKAKKIYLLSLNFSTFCFDFIARQQVSGTHMNSFILQQLPIIPFDFYFLELEGKLKILALKLYYTSWSLQDFAKDLGYNGEPFIWDEEERFQLKCELDAIYGHLYGLSREEFDYILETFPIVKRKDIEKYGTYRTKNTILKLFDEMEWVKEELRITNEKITNE